MTNYFGKCWRTYLCFLSSLNVVSVTDIPGDTINQVNKVRILFPRVTSLSALVIITFFPTKSTKWHRWHQCSSWVYWSSAPASHDGSLLLRFSIITSISLSSVINRNQPQTSAASQALGVQCSGH